jgi:hypothetical protein
MFDTAGTKTGSGKTGQFTFARVMTTWGEVELFIH